MSTEPAWLVAARAKLGTREAAGPANNPTILAWARKLGVKALGLAYNADDVPWCGLFAAICVSEAGLVPPPIAVRASSWDSWGVPARPFVGAVLRFARPGGGHVGFAVGEDARRFYVLGGNQGDRVSIAPIEKARLAACRAPANWGGARLPLPIMTSSDASSRNET